MARPVTTLVVFFVAFNLFAGMLMATGVDAAIGIDANVGGDDAVDEHACTDGEQQQDECKIDSGSPTGSTLFGMYNVLTGQLSSLFGMIFPGLAMLRRAGVPAYIVGGPNTLGFLPPLFSVMITIGILSFLRGWDL